ncbi:very short patch repair endonuclease [Pelagicoccus mobilis]|uniref:DNA mismatch endonuclease Vsr n=1 Tax=Pelagicoccus mobilis TaxID=415221 RepID=A0A934S1K5_9BACT|nr:DNA mismatch endonuclease Vsr [Pelagicoccus mobilis]MBK1878187.1 DNA mismatch endonuclease Vsr [Pelagicoccus mobilis]
MTDKISKARRSWVMSRVSGKHTKPERLVRSLLHRLGYRFTVNGPKNKTLPGRPDIVLPSRKAVIFVHGCFWHRHPGCKTATTPKSNVAYWQAKFERNVKRDQEAEKSLQEAGWHVITVWECQLKQLDSVAAHLISELPRSPQIELPEEIEDDLLVAETQSNYVSNPAHKCQT